MVLVGGLGGEELEWLPGEDALVLGTMQGAFWDLISFLNNVMSLSLLSL